MSNATGGACLYEESLAMWNKGREAYMDLWFEVRWRDVIKAHASVHVVVIDHQVDCEKMYERNGSVTLACNGESWWTGAQRRKSSAAVK